MINCLISMIVWQPAFSGSLTILQGKDYVDYQMSNKISAIDMFLYSLNLKWRPEAMKLGPQIVELMPFRGIINYNFTDNLSIFDDIVIIPKINRLPCSNRAQ